MVKENIFMIMVIILQDNKNGLRNGKGIKYYKNGKILYEGDYNNDKAEGNGKYIYENGEYYIGQFLDGEKHGKGIKYYKNGSIKYEGDFANNVYEGIGKYICENCKYYIGQWLNGKRHGKGTTYYKNGSIKYEGDFINGVYEGNDIFGKMANIILGNFQMVKNMEKGLSIIKMV